MIAPGPTTPKRLRRATSLAVPLLALGSLALLPTGRASGDPTDDGVAPGTIAYFNTADATCPPGWTVATEVQGRLIVGARDGTQAGITVGTPLADQEDRGHTHPYQAMLALPFKSVSAADGGNNSAAAAMTYSVKADTAAAPSGLPFIQLLACVKQ